MGGKDEDPEIKSAREAIAADVSEDNDEQEPTTEDAGPMTPTAGSVQEANAEGVNPDK